MSSNDERSTRLSRRLKHLCKTIPGLDDASIAAGLIAHGFKKVTTQYIQQLRTGTRTNPSLEVVFGIAEVCKVSPSYLIAPDEEAQRFEEQLAFIVALKKAGVKNLALRAAELTPEALKWVEAQVTRELQRPVAATSSTEHGEGGNDSDLEMGD